MKPFPVVILGAGPAGLAAAYEAAGRNLTPLLLERSDKLGGLARTETYKGYHFDIGGHRFFTKIGRIDRIWRDLLGPDLLPVTRVSRIYHKGRYFRYPLALLNTLHNLGFIESLRSFLSYCDARLSPYSVEETFEQWVSNRFGKRLYETFFKGYTEKVWGMPCDRIRAHWAAQRIGGLSFTAALANALTGARNAKTLIEQFSYPRTGPGLMWEKFRNAIEKGGGQFRLKHEAVRVRHENGRIMSVLCRNNDGLEEIPVEHLVSSIPLTELVTRLEPGPPERILETAGRLSYRSFLLVGLIIDRPHLFPDQWIYIHNPEVGVGRIQNFKNWSPFMVPDAQMTSIGMEYFCDEGDDLWSRTDDALVRLGSEELSRLALCDPRSVVDGFVVRQPKAYPIYDAYYEGHLQTLRDFLRNLGNLQTVGRNGLHRYNNMDHSMQTGILAIENIFGSSHDLWSVNEEEVYLEERSRADAPKTAQEKALSTLFSKLDKMAFAAAVGSLSGLLFFLMTLWAVLRGGPNLDLLGQYFIGYATSLKGAFVAFGYGSAWGFVFGWTFAYLRNLIFALYIYRVKRKTEMISLRDLLDHLWLRE